MCTYTYTMNTLWGTALLQVEGARARRKEGRETLCYDAPPLPAMTEGADSIARACAVIRSRERQSEFMKRTAPSRLNRTGTKTCPGRLERRCSAHQSKSFDGEKDPRAASSRMLHDDTAEGYAVRTAVHGEKKEARVAATRVASHVWGRRMPHWNTANNLRWTPTRAAPLAGTQRPCSWPPDD